MWNKICPSCNDIKITYSRKCDLTRSINHGYICDSCKQKLLKCPNPLNNINCKGYTTSAPGKCCRSCASFGNMNGNYNLGYYRVWLNEYGEEVAKQMNELVSVKKSLPGDRNGMYGKRHSPDSIQKIKDNQKIDENARKKMSDSAIKRFERTIGMSYNDWILTLDDRVAYYKLVYNITKKQPLSRLNNFELRGPSGTDGAYHLDHIIPIKYGYENNIPPDVIGHISNLQMLPYRENIQKSDSIDTDTYFQMKSILRFNEKPRNGLPRLIPIERS